MERAHMSCSTSDLHERLAIAQLRLILNALDDALIHLSQATV